MVANGGDGSRTSQFGGEILIFFVSPRPIDVGEHLELPDGSVGTVERRMERSDSQGVKQTVMGLHPLTARVPGPFSASAPCPGPVPQSQGDGSSVSVIQEQGKDTSGAEGDTLDVGAVPRPRSSPWLSAAPPTDPGSERPPHASQLRRL
jgi:hypothetical protein